MDQSNCCYVAWATKLTHKEPYGNTHSTTFYKNSAINCMLYQLPFVTQHYKHERNFSAVAMESASKKIKGSHSSCLNNPEK